MTFLSDEGPEPESCFQQWFPSHFHDPEEDTRFHTAEQFMMYHKALLMSDSSTARRILACTTPAEAKTLGREVQGFDQKIWDEHCDEVVEKGNWLKFSQASLFDI